MIKILNEILDAISNGTASGIRAASYRTPYSKASSKASSQLDSQLDTQQWYQMIDEIRNSHCTTIENLGKHLPSAQQKQWSNQKLSEDQLNDTRAYLLMAYPTLSIYYVWELKDTLTRSSTIRTFVKNYNKNGTKLIKDVISLAKRLAANSGNSGSGGRNVGRTPILITDNIAKDYYGNELIKEQYGFFDTTHTQDTHTHTQDTNGTQDTPINIDHITEWQRMKISMMYEGYLPIKKIAKRMKQSERVIEKVLEDEVRWTGEW